MSKKNLKHIEELQSVYQFSDQYSDSTTPVKQVSTLCCVRMLLQENKSSKNFTLDDIKKRFSCLSDEEVSAVLSALTHYAQSPSVPSETLKKIQSEIHETIKTQWIDGSISIAKKIIPIILIAAVIFVVGKKIFFPLSWRATYFQNTQLSGIPYGTYDEAMPNHNWGYEPPHNGMSPNNYSVRFESTLIVEEADYYTFRTVSDDGIRLYINDELAMDYWIPQDSVKRETTKHLPPGEYKIRLEYFEAEAGAKVEFSVERSKSNSVLFTYPKN